jgi:hypothetical protein
MEKLRKYLLVFTAFCMGVAFALSATVFTGTARARGGNDYIIVKSAQEVIRLGDQGYEYIGLAPGGQAGIMKK